MVEQSLIDFLKSETAKGIPVEHVKQRLVSGGWKENDVNEGIRIVQQEVFSSAPVPRAMPIRALPPVNPSAQNQSAQAPRMQAQSSSLLRPSPEAISKIMPPDDSKPAIMAPIMAVLVVLAIIGAVVFGADIKDMLLKPTAGENASGESNASTGQPATSPTFTGPVDCGTSDDCFSSQVATCTPATAAISNEYSTYVETTKGFEGENCILTLAYTKYDDPAGSGFVGKSMTCRVPNFNLASYKDYLQGEIMRQSCEGSLIDYAIQMGIA